MKLKNLGIFLVSVLITLGFSSSISAEPLGGDISYEIKKRERLEPRDNIKTNPSAKEPKSTEHKIDKRRYNDYGRSSSERNLVEEKVRNRKSCQGGCHDAQVNDTGTPNETTKSPVQEVFKLIL